MPERKPIGYWLKELDRRIEETLDHTLADEGVTRRDWQVLNALDTTPAARDAVVDALRPFWARARPTRTTSWRRSSPAAGRCATPTAATRSRPRATRRERRCWSG